MYKYHSTAHIGVNSDSFYYIYQLRVGYITCRYMQGLHVQLSLPQVPTDRTAEASNRCTSTEGLATGVSHPPPPHTHTHTQTQSLFPYIYEVLYITEGGGGGGGVKRI